MRGPLLAASAVAVTVTVPGQRVFCPSFPASSEMQSITNRSEEILFGSWETDTDDDDDRAIRVALKSYSLRKDSQNVTKRSDETELKSWFTNRKFFHYTLEDAVAKHELGSGRSSGTIGYELCFESKQSFPLKVAFHLHRGPHMTSEKLQGRDWVSARERHTALAVRLLWQARELKETQGFEHASEDRHFATAEAILEKLRWCTVAKAIALLVTSVGQVYYLKSFFESKTSI